MKEKPITSCDRDNSAPDWIIEHPESLAVFEELGIDYSCGGKSLEFVCQQRGLDVGQVIARLQQLIEASRQK